jgi:hypothetical protein
MHTPPTAADSFGVCGVCAQRAKAAAGEAAQPPKSSNHNSKTLDRMRKKNPMFR